MKQNLKNTVENIKLLKIHNLFGNPKKYSSYDQYPKDTDFRNSKQKNILLIPVCKYAKSTPWGDGLAQTIVY